MIRGLGAEIINYLAAKAADAGLPLLRFDTFNAKPGLIEYYLGIGCIPIRRISTPYGSDVIGWQRPTLLHRNTLHRIRHVDNMNAQRYRTGQLHLTDFSPRADGFTPTNPYSLPWLSTIEPELRDQEHLFETVPVFIEPAEWLPFVHLLLMVYKTPATVLVLPTEVPGMSRHIPPSRTRGDLVGNLAMVCLRNRETLWEELARDEHNALARLFRCIVASEGILPLLDNYSAETGKPHRHLFGKPSLVGTVLMRERQPNAPPEVDEQLGWVQVWGKRTGCHFRDIPPNLNIVPLNLRDEFQRLAKALVALGGGLLPANAFHHLDVGLIPAPTPTSQPVHVNTFARGQSASIVPPQLDG